MFGRIGAPELILILAIALIIFGPSKLPQIGKALGRGIGEFRAHAKKITEDTDEDESNSKDDIK